MAVVNEVKNFSQNFFVLLSQKTERLDKPQGIKVTSDDNGNVCWVFYFPESMLDRF